MLRTRVDAALLQALATIAGRPSLDSARVVMDDARNRLAEPMRVALAGRVSSGKSTLANALIGGALLSTGPTARTHAVTELRYASRPSLLIHYRDGTSVQYRSLDQLAALSTMDDGSTGNDINRLVVHGDFPYLQALQLIDTPGMESQRAGDTAATVRTVRLAAKESSADAVVLVIDRRGLAGSDRDLLTQVQGRSFGVSPITTVGVLTKVEHYWPFADPLSEGERVAELTMKAAGAHRMLYELRPVCSLVAAGAEAGTEDDFDDLAKLATVHPDVVEPAVARARLFATRDDSVLAIAADRRAILLERLSGYGIVLATRLIRDGVSSWTELQAALIERSGLPDLRRLLVDHFGNRGDLIRTRRLIDTIRALPAALDSDAPSTDRAALTDAIVALEALAHDEHSFAELALLQRHYDGTFPLSAELLDELLRVAGEHGTHVSTRLDLQATTPVAALREHARRRITHWNAIVADPTTPGGQRELARVLRRSYERIGDHIERAQLHLEMAL